MVFERATKVREIGIMGGMGKKWEIAFTKPGKEWKKKGRLRLGFVLGVSAWVFADPCSRSFK